MEPQWADVLKSIANHHPDLVVFTGLTIILLPKILDFFNGRKKLEIESKKEYIESLIERSEKNDKTMCSVRHELVEWRDKYYKTQNEWTRKYHEIDKELTKALAENRILKAQLQELKKRCDCGDDDKSID